MPFSVSIILIVLCGYAIGNISFARILSHIKKRDISKEGSGNPGTMNMLRTFGFPIAFLNLILEALKGAIPAVLAGYVVLAQYGSQYINLGICLGGISTVLGHNFPVVYKFKGGKGVASLLGMFCVLNPTISLLSFVVAFLYLYFFDYGVVASFIFLTSVTTYEIATNTGDIAVVILLAFSYALTAFMHRKNFVRLFTGKESKVHLRSSIKKLFKKKSKKQDESKSV